MAGAEQVRRRVEGWRSDSPTLPPAKAPAPPKLAFLPGMAERGGGCATERSAPGFHVGPQEYKPRYALSRYPIMPPSTARATRSVESQPWAGGSTRRGSLSGTAARRSRNRPSYSTSGQIVTTFGNSVRFSNVLSHPPTPGPQHYETAWNHPNTCKHVFRSADSPQMLGGGPRKRAQHGFVSQKTDTFNPVDISTEGGPQAYYPQHPTIVKPTFNKHFQLQIQHSNTLRTPRPPSARSSTAASSYAIR